MKKQNFFIWYYLGALWGLLKIWGNFFRFFWNFFYIGNLFLTLFSPWKKDMLGHEWQGFRPILLAQTLILNGIFRVFGAIVRLTFIFTGLLFEVFVLFFGFIIFLSWLFFPFLIILIFSNFAKNFFGGFYSFGVAYVLFFGFLVVYSFLNAKKPFYEDLTLEGKFRQRWFERVLFRLGIKKEEFEKAVLIEKQNLAEFLKKFDLEVFDFEEVLAWEIEMQKKKDLKGKFWRWEILKRNPSLARYWAYGYTYHLDQCSTEISKSDLSEYGDLDLVAHKNELDSMVLALEKPYQNNVILVGNAGIGKKSLIHFLAKKVRYEEMNKKINDLRFLTVNLGVAVSAAKNSGKDPNHFVNSIFIEASNAENIVLIIENAAKYFEVNENFPLSLAAIIDEYLELPHFRAILTATDEEYHYAIEKHENILKGCQLVKVNEYDSRQSLGVLFCMFEGLEYDNPVFTYKALKRIIKSSGSLGKITPLPGRAVKFAKDSLLFARKQGFSIVDEDLVLQLFSMRTGTAQGKINQGEREKLLNMEKVLHQRVVGQDQAISQLANVIRKMRAGIRDEKKPIGSFLFLGPTGVGKTETAKTLAEAYFGHESKMIRFDMSEYQNESAIDRLIGSRATGQSGVLANMVKDNPFSLILLDEIEKAYTGVLDLFLQVLDEGMLTDAFGDKVNFRGTIIIATSNVGANLISQLIQAGKTRDEINKLLIDEIVKDKSFRVEFLNRFSEVVFFDSLDKEEMMKVVTLKLNKIVKRLDKEKNIQLSFSNDVVEKIIKDGYDPIFGARSITRFLGQKVENGIAKKIIAGDLGRGDELCINAEDLQ